MLSRLFSPPVPLTGASRSRAPRRARRLGFSMLAAVALWLLAPAVASAHAHLTRADPAPGSVIARAPSVALFTFDEPLNPALTSVRIADAAGHTVATGRGSLAPGHDGELWQVPLSQLGAGTYSVFWTSKSATDGHVMSSFYTFRVAPNGSAGGVGAVTGAAAGGDGGGAGAGSSGSGPGLGLGGGALATALLHWLGLMAQALWLGALLVELAVLAPVRRGAGTPATSLARAAAPRVWRLARLAPVVVVWALAGEVVSLALAGTGGDWGRALDPETLSGILSSQNGRLVLVRFAALLVALALTGWASAPAAAPATEGVPHQPGPARRNPRAVGIIAPPLGRGAALPALRWESVRLPLTLLAALYMLLAALSGHAADVNPLWLSYGVDWLHLVCTAAWAGGIAALAFGVLPLRHALPPGERAPAALPLLDRFSPVAYAAVGALALSGLFNAVSHVAEPSVLVGSTYGQLLIVKLALVALLAALSATHVYVLRPRMARLGRDAGDAVAVAAVHEGLATLAARLRLESMVGAAILLATALMSQTLPPGSAPAPAAPASAARTPEIVATLAAISGVATAGDLRGTLTVAPPAVGTTTFTLALAERGTPLDENSAAAIIHLYPAARPDLRATLDTVARGTRFSARGSLPSTGTWRADALVRTAMASDYRTLPFTFTAGPGAAFIEPGRNPAAVALRIDPGRLGVPNTVTITGVRASGVRLLSETLDMRMGILPYTAVSLGAGRWRAGMVYPLMSGRWALTVQARRGGAWVSLRRFVYQVPTSGAIRLLDAGSGAPLAPSGAAATTVSPGAVRWSGLPYRAVVSFVDNGLVYVPGQARLTHVGAQNHSVARAPDGTIWVTDYVGGRVAVLDPVSGRVIGSVTVGLAPAHIVFTRDGRRAYVSDYLSSDITVVDVHARRKLTTISGLGLAPHGLALTPDNKQLWVPCSNGGGIYIIDTGTNRVIATVPTGGFPHAVTFAPDGRTAYLTDATPGAGSGLLVIDVAGHKIRARVPIGTGSAMVLTSPDGRRVYVTGQGGSVLTVVDAAALRVIARIQVGKAPHGLAFTPDGRLLYVASNDGHHVAVVDTGTDSVVATVPVPGSADELALERS